MKTTCQVCEGPCPENLACPCGVHYCSKDCQRAVFSDHKIDCLTKGFGVTGHYSYWFDQVTNHAISPELKSELKSCSVAFLEAYRSLSMGERVSGSTIRQLWTHSQEVLEKLPQDLLKDLRSTINEPSLENSKAMLNCVKDIQARKLVKDTVKCCMVCLEPFSERRERSELPCSCTEDMCFDCFSQHLVRTAKKCRCSDNFKVKCPNCKNEFKVLPQVLEICQHHTAMNLW